jgi:hypothetical protein
VNIALGLVGVLAALVCSDPQAADAEKLVNEGVKVVQDLGGVLKTVKDKTTAEAAVPKLETMTRGGCGLRSHWKSSRKMTNSNSRPWSRNTKSEGFGALKTEMSRGLKDAELLKICNTSEAFKQEFGSFKVEIARAKREVRALEAAPNMLIRNWVPNRND